MLIVLVGYLKGTLDRHIFGAGYQAGLGTHFCYVTENGDGSFI